jgi:hypothetical protein
MSRSSIAPATAARNQIEELEKLEQEITLTLQREQSLFFLSSFFFLRKEKLYCALLYILS